MLNNINWSYNRSYRTGTENEPIEFYLNALSNSNQLELLLGYFSTSAISLLSLGFAKFIYNNGNAKIIINNILSEKDKNILEKSSDKNSFQIFSINDIQQIKEALDNYGKHFFECIAWLISQNKLEFKVIKPKDKQGIAHYKSGVFSDGSNKIGFKGSVNFTATGLLENLEELDIYLSWENGRSNKWINGQEEYFKIIYSGNADFVDYLEVKDIQTAIYNEFGDKNINQLLIQEKELIEKKKIFFEKNEKVLELMEQIQNEINIILREPKFPYPSGPREYQKEAYENWKNNNFQGIFAMATGTGKTITSLNCVLEEYKKSEKKTYHSIILVPTITLVEQWEKEAKSFNFNNVIKVSSKFDWKKELATTLSISKRIPTSFIVISTYASFIKDSFQNLINKFPTDTIFIADEGHNLASPSVLKALKGFPLQKRIGLSATPKRIYDLEGTFAMESFFNDAEPYIYSYSMYKAIDTGVLCQYYYYPNIIKLTSDEFSEYHELTKKLSKYFAYSQNNSDMSEIAQTLLLKRKRIIHKAENKLKKTVEILKEEFEKRGNLNYTFIYVPEGLSNEVNENCTEEEENIKLINLYTREIAKIDDAIIVNQFISGMKERDEILSQFKNGKIQVIASMKCLDEGVDIPRAEYAIFCSSTGNPRQFIQRRGRILRKHPDKHLATIYDLVVIPDFENFEINSETFQTEKNLIKTELERVMYFASLSINPFFTEEVFKEVCEYYDINLYTIQNELKTV